MSANFTEIRDFQQLKGIINKSQNVKQLVYYYCKDANQDCINQLVKSVRKYGKRTTKLYICNLCLYPGMNQETQSVCLYSEGHKLFQLNGNPGQKIIDEIMSRYI